MFWQEPEDEAVFRVPENIVDLNYRLDGKRLPLDHAQALSDALHRALPWLDEEPLAGIHSIHVAESGNGWYRPTDTENEVLHLSRRTRLSLRLPRERIEQAGQLSGATLDIDGFTLGIGEAQIKPLSDLGTLFARYVVAPGAADENEFLANCAAALKAMEIPVRRLMAGRMSTIRTNDEPLTARTLMIADLPPPATVKLQQLGLGPGRKLGCGLFIPHKGIEAVSKTKDQQ
ncbi:MAG: type I-MYXAN CRISPR-associated protein Cas6/Cmx6 [Chromatiales bacterium]|nr:type I-MYXAN CRISPR-associated protein Cas6/Cmx6 [Chromatiales bacterium]